MDIINLKELIEPYLEDSQQIISYDCKSLLPPGENYGSVIMALNIKVKSKNEEDVIQCIAKTVPPSKIVWEVFNTPVTFKKEIAFYNKVVPLLNNYGEENGVNNLMRSFARCFGARISLDPASDVVDNDAALILENLKVEGYEVGDRFTGFDLETTKLILRNLADLHAGPIALKLNNSTAFETQLRPYFNKGIIFEGNDSMLDNLVQNVEKFASKNPKCIPLLSRINKGVRQVNILSTYNQIREPFATIMHNDMWSNNIMVKFKDKKPESVKFVDFQMYEYGSPSRDVIFFLYSSVRLDVLNTKVDELIQFYYDRLIEMLKKLKCKVDLLTYDEFRKDIDEVARDTEFAHITFMLTPILTLKGKANDLSEWKPDDLAPEEEFLHENYSSRIQFTILDFAKRNWI